MKIFLANEIQEKKILGRAKILEDSIAIFWSASGIELNVRAGELWAGIDSDFSTHEVWIAIFIDGAQTARLMLGKGRNEICVFRNMNPEIVKNVRIYKETQAMECDARHKMILKDFRTDGIFLPVKNANVKIEFIGDSITSGEGAVGAKIECDWISAFFGATKTYAFKLAQMLGADFNVISQSGWGTVTGYDNDTSHALPAYYEKTCGVLRGSENETLGAQSEWNFSLWQPDLIIVNLGTNDQGAFMNPPFAKTNFKMKLRADGTPEKSSAEFFEKGVVDFLKFLRAKNPGAKIFWCYGMMGRLLAKNIEAALELYKKQSGDANAHFVLLPEMDSEESGALCHPSEAQHEIAARFLYEKISPFFARE